MPNATMIEAHESKGVQGGLYRAPRKTLWWAWLLTACLAGWGATSSNGLLTSGAVIALAVAIQLLWRNEEVPVLVFALGMQWLQASAAIFYTDLNGLSLAGEFGSQQIVIASWLSLIAVVVLAIAIRIALLRSPNDLRTTVQRSAKRIDVVRSFVVYAISCVIATFVMQFAWAVPSFTQILLPLAAVKWAFVFILAYAVFEQRNGYGYLIAAVAIEFFIGAIGFFSDFKSVFFVVTVACLSSRFALRGRRLVLLVLIFAILLSTGVLWSAIKTEYRDYVNGGTGQQTVTVPVEERVFKLGDLVSRFNATDINNGLDAMILRVSYVYYFALAMSTFRMQCLTKTVLCGGALLGTYSCLVYFSQTRAQ